ncbi:MAG: hypothetical protein IRZ03_11055 [Acidobacterium ailaaui]|nr:hypothetical protein [Pseudacidobacterium ailaaui]
MKLFRQRFYIFLIPFLFILFFFLPLLVESFHWYQLVDSPVLNYISYLLLNGKIIYRDVFDINLPGCYCLIMFSEKFLGISDTSFRIFDLILLIFSIFSIIMIFRRINLFISIFSALCFASIHLAGGPADLLERDYLLIPFIGFATYFFFKFLKNPENSFFNLFMAGFLFSYAIIIKPFVSILALFYILFYFFTFLHKVKQLKLLINILSFFSFLLIFPSIMIIWIYHIHSLQQFLFIFFKYAPVFYQNRQDSLKNIILSMLFTPVGFYLFILFMLIPFYPILIRYLKNNSDYKILFFLLLISCTWGFISYFFQITVWPYHLYPLYFYLSCLVSFIIFILINHTKSFVFYVQSFQYLILLSLFLDFLMYRTLVGKSNYINQYYANPLFQPVQDRPNMINDIIHELSHVVSAGDTVEVYDNTQEGDNILFRMHLFTPTRFVQEIHFSWGNIDENKYIRQIWEEYIYTFFHHPPKAIIIFSSNKVFDNTAFSNVKFYQQLYQFVDSHYSIYKKSNYYSILVRNY